MDWDMENEVQWMTLSIILFTTLIVSFTFWNSGVAYPFRNSQNGIATRAKQKFPTVNSCKNPNCIRCRRYRNVQERARSKLSWILRDWKSRDPSTFAALNRRIPDAILRPGTNENDDGSFQDPTVLMVPNLPSREIVTDWHQNACNYLKERQTRTIVNEALQSLVGSKISGVIDDHQLSDDSKWTVNDSSPDGDWRVFQILNQGVWNPVLLREERNNEACQELLELVRKIPGLLNNCLFGNAFVSKIYPGTNIEPHCGPTNVRHRLQFLVKLPDDFSSSCSLTAEDCTANCDKKTPPTLSLSVGREENIFWDMRNDTFVFDDSFVHSVTYSGERRDGRTNSKKEILRNEDSLARMVLIVDLWHPGLQDIEMKLLQDLYSPFE